MGNDLPVGPYRSYTPEYWLAAGPFPGSETPDDGIAALRPRIGADATLNGKTLKFAALPARLAGSVPPSFSRKSELQGTGDTMPDFDALVDPTCCSGKDASGLLYTVIDNPVERVVKPAYYEDRMRGITVWIGDYKIRRDEAVRLLPGLYPVMIRIDPSFYDREVRLDEMPIDVAAATAAKAVDAPAWPTTWRVLGPLPSDLATLPQEQLAAMPGAVVKLDGEDYDVHDVPVRDGKLLNLAGLMFVTKGIKYDWSKAPMEVDVMTPFTAYCYAEIEVPQDGSLYVNSGADWFMRWYVDGVAVLDTMQSGNPGGPRDVRACAFEVPLKKGRHVLCVMTRPGSKGWSVSSLGAFSSKPKVELKAYELVRGRKDDFDFRFRPHFSEVANPDVMAARYATRLKAAEARLKDVVAALPDSIEARTAKALLAKIGTK
jgi:hypothetical protein